MLGNGLSSSIWGFRPAWRVILATFIKALGVAGFLAGAMTMAAPAATQPPDAALTAGLVRAYADVIATEPGHGKAFDIHVTRLGLLVLAAGRHAQGSPGLDAILGRIQRERPMLLVPPSVMTPAELERLLDQLADDPPEGPAFATYLTRPRIITELIDRAKRDITARSGFVFGSSVPERRTQ